jgi:hypothetical protein
VFPARVSSKRHFAIQVPPFPVFDVDALIKDEDRTEDDGCGSYIPGQCPTISETRGVLARRVLGNPYFYNDKKRRSEASWKERRYFLGDKKIEQIETEYGTPDGRIVVSSETACCIKRLGVFFDQVAGSAEDELHDKIIPLNADEDIKRIHTRWVPLGSWTALLDESIARSEKKDGNTIYILGPSGSGKTFLAATQASRYIVKHERWTTIYMNVADSGVPFKDSQTAGELVKWIKQELKKQVKSFDPDVSERLNMHVSFVLDEAGSSVVYDFFEKKLGIKRLYTLLTPFALSVRLIVCGTGLTGEKVCSRSDVCKVRMNQWDQNDLKLVAAKMFWGNFKSTKERDHVIAYVVASIFEYPVLAGLATNSRSAWFVLEAVNERFRLQNSVQSTWKEFLGESTGYIVSRVVDKYVEHNGLGMLSPFQRRHVAALVLDIVEQSKANARVMATPGPGDKWYAPTFQGPAAKYRDYVSSCISFNVNYMSSGAELFPGQTLSVSLSPALAIVVFAVLGAPSSVLVTWRSQELIAALYIFRRMVLQFCQEFKELQHDLMDPNEHWTQLDHRLSSLRLIQAKKRIPEGRTSPLGTFRLPAFGNETVWLNKDQSPFVDAVGPYIFGQAKKTEKGKSTVHIVQELLKCGLLHPTALEKGSNKDQNRGKCGWIVTRGLCEVWKNNSIGDHLLPSTTLEKEVLSDCTLRALRKRRDLSDGYPENLLAAAEEIDTTKYISVSQKNVDGLRTSNELEKEIIFFVTYNAPELDIYFNFKSQNDWGTVMKVWEHDLDDGVFNPTREDPRFPKWHEFLSMLRTHVVIKFLPT